MPSIPPEIQFRAPGFIGVWDVEERQLAMKANHCHLRIIINTTSAKAKFVGS
jgi:hypothetical protein